MSVKKASSFVKEVMARITGDSDKATAERNYRLASAAIEGQLSSLTGSRVKAEVELETKQDNLESAIYPTKLIDDSGEYCRNIAYCQEKVNDAQDKLDAIEVSIAYFEALRTKVNG
jgi:hypothetical protein